MINQNPDAGQPAFNNNNRFKQQDDHEQQPDAPPTDIDLRPTNERWIDESIFRRHFNRAQLAGLRKLPYGFEKCIFDPYRYTISTRAGERIEFEKADITADGRSVRLSGVTAIHPDFDFANFGLTRGMFVRVVDVVSFFESGDCFDFADWGEGAA